MKVQHYSVEGEGVFPIDMLRCDQSFPYDDISSGQIDYHWQSKRTVTLARHVQSVKDMPYDTRWKSFGWRVIPGSVTTY